METLDINDHNFLKNEAPLMFQQANVRLEKCHLFLLSFNFVDLSIFDLQISENKRHTKNVF